MDSFEEFARAGYFGELGDLLLVHGREYFPGEVPEHLASLRGPAKMCFRTCAELALQYPEDLVYAEGYAFADIPMRLPLAHAWLLHRDCVVDPTWSGGSGYFGIEFSAKQLQHYLLVSEQYGILQSLWCEPRLREAFEADFYLPVSG